MDIQLPESERRWLHAALVLGTLVLALVLVAQVSVILVFFTDILLILLLAWLLAFILSPLVGLTLRAFPKLPRVLVVGVVYVLLFLGLSAITLVVAGSLGSSISSFLASLPTLQARLPETLAGIQNGLAGLGFQVDLVKAAQDLLGNLGNLGDKLVGPLTDLAIFSLGIVGNLLLVIFLSLFIILDQERMLAYVNRLVPPRYGETARLFESSVSTSFGGFIRGQAIQGLVFAAVVALAHILFGLEFLPVSTALAGILQLIPFFGPLLSWAPPIVIALLTKPDAVIPTLILVGAGWFIVGNVITPRVMSKAVGIHPVVVLVSVLVGIKVAGIAGAIFALPFAAIGAAFLQHYLARNAGAPRDVTSRAAQRVGEREGRVVRVPTAPAAGIAAGAGAVAEPVADAVDDEPRKRSRGPAEPAP
ncbi:MAG TPA: AI-2E family transporter [Candidatus Limnocylindria bacterium]|nr:AI-2E family transporter [Candidatus Limnocylindria bacterium]